MGHSSLIILLTLLLHLLHQAAPISAHACMNFPNQRGALSALKSPYILNSVNESREIVTDFWMHFPAGDKTPRPGAGLKSQIAAVAPRKWTPFDPTNPRFPWRSGVCGDLLDGNAHLKGGKYYNNGEVVATFRQGSTIDVGLSIVAHHNGYIELHVCDVAKCRGGEISRSCFREGHCRQLERKRNSVCDSGTSTKCGPIDRNYTGRWYLPCRQTGTRWHTRGNDGTILYKLPEDLNCEHCVVQWFYTAANTCNPPGVVDYFKGPDAPTNWGRCGGQAGAIGGFTDVQRPCGDIFAEEYLQCADIRITPRSGTGGSASDPTPTGTPSPSPSESSAPLPSGTPSPSVTVAPSSSPGQSRTPVSVGTPMSSPTPTVTMAPDPSPEPTSSMTGGVDDDEAEPSATPAVFEYPEYEVEGPRRQRYGGVRDIVLIGDGRRILSLNAHPKVNVSSFEHVTVEALTADDVSEVAFFIGGTEFIDKRTPFYLYGNDGDDNPRYSGEDDIVGRRTTIVVSANGDNDRLRMFLHR